MKKAALILLAFSLLFSMTACRNEGAGSKDVSQRESEKISEAASTDAAVSEKEEKQVKEKSMKMMIGNTTVEVDWEDNESVDVLRELAQEKPLTVDMSMYGGFEQVGSLGVSLPRNDVQTTAQACDIVLYSGDQIVVFYGSNSWAYTRLGHITDKTDAEMTGLLGNGDVTITLSVE